MLYDIGLIQPYIQVPPNVKKDTQWPLSCREDGSNNEKTDNSYAK